MNENQIETPRIAGRIVGLTQEIMNGAYDTRIDPKILSSRLSHTNQDEKIAYLSGYSKDDPELKIVHAMLKNIAVARSLSELPENLLYLDPSVMVIARAAQAMFMLSQVAEDTVKFRCTRNILAYVESASAVINSGEEVIASLREYLAL